MVFCSTAYARQCVSAVLQPCLVGKYVGDNALAAVGSSYDRFFVYGFKRSDKAFIN